MSLREQAVRIGVGVGATVILLNTLAVDLPAWQLLLVGFGLGWGLSKRIT